MNHETDYTIFIISRHVELLPFKIGLNDRRILWLLIQNLPMDNLICLHLTVHTGSSTCKDNLTCTKNIQQTSPVIGQLIFQLYNSATQWNELILHKSKKAIFRST